MPKTVTSIIVASSIVFWLLFATLSHAGDLDALVNQALTNSPELAAAKARWQQASYKSPQVGSLMDPVLSFALSNYPSDTLDSDSTPMTGNEIKLSQMFPFPGKLLNKAALADEQARWFEAIYKDNHYMVARKVKDAWYRLYYNQKAIEVLEKNLALVDDVIRLTEVRYETGAGLQQDVLKAQVQRSRMTEQLMALRQQNDSLQAELNKLLNSDEEQQFEAPQVLELPKIEFSVDKLAEAALENRPMTAAYRALVNQFHHQQRLAELDDYPDVTLWGSWRFRDDDLPDRGTDFVSAGVSFNLPVYREKRRAAQAEARAAIVMAERQAETFRNNVTESIRKAYARMSETLQQAELYKLGIIPQTGQSFQASLSAYQVGSIAFMSLLDSLMATYKAEMDYYRFSSEYLRSLAWLESESTIPLTGSPIVFDGLN